jgi:hypothetical protein
MILPEACEQRSTAHWRGPALRRPRRRAISYQRTTSASLRRPDKERADRRGMRSFLAVVDD